MNISFEWIFWIFLKWIIFWTNILVWVCPPQKWLSPNVSNSSKIIQGSLVGPISVHFRGSIIYTGALGGPEAIFWPHFVWIIFLIFCELIILLNSIEYVQISEYKGKVIWVLINLTFKLCALLDNNHFVTKKIILQNFVQKTPCSLRLFVLPTCPNLWIRSLGKWFGFWYPEHLNCMRFSIESLFNKKDNFAMLCPTVAFFIGTFYTTYISQSLNRQTDVQN